MVPIPAIVRTFEYLHLNCLKQFQHIAATCQSVNPLECFQDPVIGKYN